MSSTLARPMTIRQARALLADTRRASSEQIRVAEQLIRELHSRRPDHLPQGGVAVVPCQACGNATWSLHADGDDEGWACYSCHREPMSDKQALALRAAKAEQARVLAAEKEAAAAAAPKPREVLATVV